MRSPSGNSVPAPGHFAFSPRPGREARGGRQKFTLATSAPACRLPGGTGVGLWRVSLVRPLCSWNRDSRKEFTAAAQGRKGIRMSFIDEAAPGEEHEPQVAEGAGTAGAAAPGPV